MSNGAGINPFAVLAVVGKYGELIRTITDMAPELEHAYNEALPHISGLNALLVKHKPTINKLEAMTPEIQAFVRELLPLVQQ